MTAPRVALAGAVTALVGGALVMGASPVAADQIRDDQWHLDHLNIDRVHELSQGAGITVAVLDSGVNGNHEDLAGNVQPGVDTWEATHGGDAGDGWNDQDGHGTGMAGLVAAHGHGPGNGDGALGIAPQAQVIPIRVQPGSVDTLDTSYSDSFHLAIQEAMSRGADIISIAQSGFQPEHVQPALDAGIIVVVSAGNQPDNFFLNAPPGTVAVGAVRSDGAIADVSVRGSQVPPPLDQLGTGVSAQFGFVWLTAPGEDIVSTSNTGGYRIGTGTSPSTSIVAGAAAVVWSHYPDLTGNEVIHHLLQTSTDKGAPGPDTEYGYGDLDLVRALETQPTPPGPATTTTTTGACGDMVCAPPTLPPDESAAAVGDGERAGTIGVGALVAVIAAVVAAGSLSLSLVSRRRHRLAHAGADPATLPLGRPAPPGGPALPNPSSRLDGRPPPPAPPSPGHPGPWPTSAQPPPRASASPPPPAAPAIGPAGAARAPRAPRVLLVVAVLAVVVAAASGVYALTQQDDDESGGEPREAAEPDGTALPVGDPPTDPPTGVPDLDGLAQSCFEGTMNACDTLYWRGRDATTASNPAAAEYQRYGDSCGGRTRGATGLCSSWLADS